MEKAKEFTLVRFSPEVIERARQLWLSFLPSACGEPSVRVLTVWVGDSQYGHDNLAEFFSDYRRASSAIINFICASGDTVAQLYLEAWSGHSKVQVKLAERQQMEAVFAIFEDAAPQCRLAVETTAEKVGNTPGVFVGHGRSKQWRDLKDHLQDQHGYDVTAYEVGARAGHTIRDILEEMLAESSFALLVLTGEDEDAEGRMHARENVIHETGLFQGRLGFARAIVLQEEGTNEFSNVHGIHQIRFSRGNIRETFGDVLATLRREFAANDGDAQRPRSRH